MTTIEPAPKLDQTNCDREPIHIPGSIQPHGCLLACDVSARAVLRHSANAAAMLKIDGSLNGRKLEDLFEPDAVHALRNALARAGSAVRPKLLIGLDIRDERNID